MARGGSVGVAEVERRIEPAGQDRVADFFVSYTPSDRTWAEWIAWQLEDTGHSVVIQAWDMRPGADFVAAMREAAACAARTVPVLSPEHLRSDFALSEWDAAYAADPLGREGKLLPVRVAEFTAEGLDRVRVWIDLVGLDEEGAPRTTLGRLPGAGSLPWAPPRTTADDRTGTCPRTPALDVRRSSPNAGCGTPTASGTTSWRNESSPVVERKPATAVITRRRRSARGGRSGYHQARQAAHGRA